MSELFSIKILSVIDREVKCRIEVVHPDQYNVPCEKNIALQIVLEFYENCKNGFIYNSNYQKYSFNEKEGLKMAENHPLKEEFERITTFLRGENQKITEEEYNQLTKEWPDEISSMGMFDGVYSKTYQPRYSEFLKAADSMIESVSISNELNNPRPSDDTEGEFDPKADMTFTVKDKNIIYHMRGNCFFGSAMFDISNY